MKLQNTNRRRGGDAEEFAARYLEKNGYRIREKNYHFSHNETDIIAEDDTYIIFVEVKARKNTESSMRFGRPAAAVTKSKQTRLIECARGYLATHFTSKQPRLDVIELYLNSDGAITKHNTEIKHIKNAFHS